MWDAGLMGTSRKNEGRERQDLLVLPGQPSCEDAPSVLGCGFGSGRHGCRLPAPRPVLWEHPPRKARTRFRAAPVPALSHPTTLSHAGEIKARRYASSRTRRLPVGRAWAPRKAETGSLRGGHHGEEQADVDGSPRQRLPMLQGAYPGDVTSEGVTWHRRV